MLLKSPRDGDYVELHTGKTAADVILKFGEESGKGRLAFWIEDVLNPTRVGPVNCLPQIPTEDYALRGIPQGTFRVNAVLWEALGALPQPRSPADLGGGPGAHFAVSCATSVTFHVRYFEEFAADYDWQVVQPWHRPLPSGLEISMDIGAGSSAAQGARKARIPTPWQWDVSVDGEVRRVSVEGQVTISEILRRLGLSADTHEVVWTASDSSGRQLEHMLTARQANLFVYKRDLCIRARGSK
eukprot:gnl/TRDRNA2_/TRDRNA2_95051_c0_seq1.p1 gnl/TRDRNA2_/TRDRNA2_95051_c0~~gnl/TRDRNA2_/TRDRNA2_95051_c0_seq1.p1  ORF type:complete len:269 (-),score=31.18 gnl/TRDRNA2_/TRDRNA2_95051_c0_seq1:4-729(-)